MVSEEAKNGEDQSQSQDQGQNQEQSRGEKSVGNNFESLQALFDSSGTPDDGVSEGVDAESDKSKDEKEKEKENEKSYDTGSNKDSEGKKEETPDETTMALKSLRDEMSEMRTMLLAAARKNNLLSQELDLTKKKLTESGTLPEVSKEDAALLTKQRNARNEEVENYLETMRLSNKYGDIDSVVTQRRVDDMVNVLARGYSKKEGLELSEAIDHVQQWVWNGHKNPYRWLYDELKSKHPDFLEKEGKKGGEDGKKPVAPSLSNMQGSGSGGSGNSGVWTSKRIDDMPEEELSSVPSDVYKKYMNGELD